MKLPTGMKLPAAMAAALFLLASVPTPASEASASSGSETRPAVSNDAPQKIIITRNGSRPSAQGPADDFTGFVRIDPLFETKAPSPTSGAYVTFEPGARSAWHTHPLSQILTVTAGVGRVQRWGDPVEEIRPDDVVWIPPGQKHWHGASPTTAMTPIAITGTINGKNVEGLEKVTDEQYNGKLRMNHD